MAKKKKSKTIKVDFTGVTTHSRWPDGDFIGVLDSIEHDADKGDHGIVIFNYEITRGSRKGKILDAGCSLAPGALFKLKQRLEDHGIEVPDSAMDLDIKAIEEEIGDEEIGIIISNREVGDKTYTDVDIVPADEVEPDEGEEAEDGKDNSDGGDDKPDRDDIMDMDEDELEEVVDDHDLDVDLDDFKNIKKKRAAVADAIEADDGDDGEDKTYTKDEVNEMKAKELEALVEEQDLDCELDGKLKKKRKVVIEALEEEGLLEED